MTPIAIGDKTSIESKQSITNSGPMDSPWPMKCHDTRHTSQSPYSTAHIDGTEKWLFNSHGSVTSSPAIADDGSMDSSWSMPYHDVRHIPDREIKYYYSIILDENPDSFNYKSYSVQNNNNFNDPRFLDDGLDQYQLYDGGIGLGVGNNKSSAQSFVPAHPCLSMVKVLFSKRNDPQVGVYVSIRSSLKGDDLTYSYVKPSAFPETDVLDDWICFDFPDIAVTPGKEYYIVLYSPGQETNFSNYYWSINPDSESYHSGGGFGTVDGGETWFDQYGVDFGFKTYFCPPAEHLDQIQTAVGKSPSGPSVAGDKWLAQSFKPSLNALTKIELDIAEWDAASADLIIKIRKTLNGSDLTTASRPAIGGPMIWFQVVTFDFPDIKTTPGEQYYFICCSPEGAVAPHDRWSLKINGEADTYRRGESYYSNDCGLSWFPLDEIAYPLYDFWFRTYGYNGSSPDKPTAPSGPSKGQIDHNFTYSAGTHDPDNDRIKYCFDWGDGTYTWTCYCGSGESVSAIHRWDKTGRYKIRVKAKDEYGAESDWSNPLSVTMPRNRDGYTLLLQLFDRFLGRFPLLTRLLSIGGCDIR